jgi:hypothetical protein
VLKTITNAKLYEVITNASEAFEEYCLLWGFNNHEHLSDEELAILFDLLEQQDLSVIYAFCNVLAQLFMHEKHDVSPFLLIEKLPVMELVSKHIKQTSQRDSTLSQLPMFLKLPDEKINLACNACDAYFQLQHDLPDYQHALSSDYDDANYRLVKAVRSNPENANAIVFLGLLACSFYKDRKYLKRCSAIDEVASKAAYSEVISCFMLKLFGMEIDLRKEKVADFFNGMFLDTRFPCTEKEDHLAGFFDLALKSPDKITSEIVENLEPLTPDNCRDVAIENYNFLAKHTFSNTHKFTINSAVLKCGFIKTATKSTREHFQNEIATSLEAPTCTQITLYQLECYFESYKEEGCKEYKSYLLVLLSSDNKRVEVFLDKLESLGVLNWTYYQVIMFSLDAMQRQVLLDNFQCLEMYDDVNNIREDILKILNILSEVDNPKVEHLFCSLLLNSSRRVIGYKFMTVCGPDYVSLIRNLIGLYRLIDDVKLNAKYYKHGLMAAAMWCKAQDSVECGQLLGEIISLVSTYAEIVNGSDLHANIQTGLMLAVDSSACLQFFDNSKYEKGLWVDAQAGVASGFSRVRCGSKS